jgi:hypothetical protein
MPARAKYVPQHARRPERRGAARRRVAGVAVVGAVGVAALVWAGGRVGDADRDELATVDGPASTAVSATIEERDVSATTATSATTAPTTSAPQASAPLVSTVPLPSAAPSTEPPTTTAAGAPAAPATTSSTTLPVVTTTAPPTFFTQIATGSRQFSPGTYDVGNGQDQIPPGVYRTREPSTRSSKCEVQLFDGDQQRSPLASHGPVIVETSGATRVRIGRSCPPLTDDLSPVLPPEQLTAPGGFPAGMYFAAEIPAGTYQVLADGVQPDPDTGRRCYWSLQTRFTGREYESSGGGDEIEKNRVIDRPQRPTFIVLGWSPDFPTAGVTLEYRAVADNPRSDDPFYVPPGEIGVCTFRKIG